MDFNEAKSYVLGFGKFRGKTLDQAAETDDGLRYLDWLNGEKIYDKRLAWALREYMADPTIQSELGKL